MTTCWPARFFLIRAAVTSMVARGEGGALEKASAGLPMGKLGQVDEIADFVIFLLSERSGVVTGSVLDWDQTIPGAHD